ncbi:hypothetical protein CBL_09592 [Carabus blaptoides fortunei]
MSGQVCLTTTDQVIVVATGGNPTPSQTFQSHTPNTGETVQGDSQIQWQTPVSIATQSLFTAINEANTHFPQTMDDQQVTWEGHTIQDGEEQNSLNTLYNEPNPAQNVVLPVKKGTKIRNIKTGEKKGIIKKNDKMMGVVGNNSDPTKIEDSVVQVKERFRRGCECQDESCFRGLSPASVYKHRLNIAELTKGEHDMYLMGVTMTCLANPDTTVRRKERRRLRAQYVYQGRRVCLDAFLYLENCTQYQLKCIRKHVMTHGVAPRVHGNHGKKPHNTFSLDIYRHATEFLKQYLETHTGETGITNTKQIIQLPWDITRKNLHDAYKEYGQILEPGIKLMGYSTFRHFMKEQFPNVRFYKIERKSVNQTQIVEARSRDLQESVITGNDVQQVIPLVVAQGNDNGTVQHHQQTTFLMTSNTMFSYQLSNTGYVINEQGNIVTAMSNAQHHPPYTFNRM